MMNNVFFTHKELQNLFLDVVLPIDKMSHLMVRLCHKELTLARAPVQIDSQ